MDVLTGSFTDYKPHVIPALKLSTKKDNFTKECFLSKFGDLKFDLTENYRDSLQLRTAPRSVLESHSPNEYFSRNISKFLGPRAMFSEVPPPDGLLNILPPHWNINTRTSRLFIGREGCVSDMHVDWFSHWLLVINLFGRKKLTLVPPENSARILPMGSFSAIDFRSLKGKNRSDLLRYLDGVEFILSPGDAFLQPPLWWHHVEYLEDSATISMGIGPINEYLSSFFSDASIPRDWRLIPFYSKIAERQPLDDEQRKACELVRDAMSKNSTLGDAQKTDYLLDAIRLLSQTEECASINPLCWGRLRLPSL